MKNKTFRGGEDTMDRKILIVDDEKNIVDIIAFNLKKEGYTVITAADGEEGVQKANGGKSGSDSAGYYDAEDGWLRSLKKIRAKEKYPDYHADGKSRGAG